jgi:para-nitrobenzyl esterase
MRSNRLASVDSPRRFPLSPCTGVRDAIDHGPLPPQSRSMVAGDRNDPKYSRPSLPDGDGVVPEPVGLAAGDGVDSRGPFLNGARQLQLYDGSRLAATGNVVIVNVTYWVGVSAVSSSATSAPVSTTINAG